MSAAQKAVNLAGKIATNNAANIALIPESSRKLIFGDRKRPRIKKLEKLALMHLKNNDLLDKKTTAPVQMPNIRIPRLLGQDLDEHFQKLGEYMSQPYLDWCKDFLGTKQTRFDFKLQRTAGWTRYTKDSVEKVDYPTDEVIVFDVEVLYKISDYAVMATAMSKDAWYVWLSPWILDESSDPSHLIPLGSHQQVVIGHKVSYDRKRVKEAYSLGKPHKFYLDTMSLHIATAGMCARQRPVYQKFLKDSKDKQEKAAAVVADELDEDGEDSQKADHPWLEFGTLNGAADVYRFNFPKSKLLIDKKVRDYFASEEKRDVTDRLEELVEYCALDVYCTQQIFDKVFPSFRELCPHPVSFAALWQMGNLFLPINQNWSKYIESAEAKFEQVKSSTSETLHQIAHNLKDKSGSDKDIAEDPWLSQLDWTVKPVRFTKTGKLVKNQKLPGMPMWFRDLFATKTSPMNLTLRSRITPYLLKLQWDGNPLKFVDKSGWCFRTSAANEQKYLQLNYTKVASADEVDPHTYFKVPHKDGTEARCGNPMAKGYLPYFENGILTSQSELAVSMLKDNSSISYWLSSRERAFRQMPVYQSKDLDMGYGADEHGGLILPDLVPMGTVTRRAVENLWLTASNAKKSRVGSELKAMVTAPKGHVFVGSDVDSEELWIAGVVGDSLFGLHGGTALGWMTLEGSKSNGTDLHSRTAKILGISRDEAKVFNYGRIYGAGERFATQLLKQFNPNLSNGEAGALAKKLYKKTKGNKVRGKNQFWRGGSESVAFNQLELMAMHDQQRTPILGAGITAALLSKNLGVKNNYLTSRINWSIQSSGVDYLHLLIVSVYYLCEVYSIEARLMITIHDELRYMCKEQDQFRLSLALQIANLWTRAMFCQQLGMDDLPQSVAFFSAIDIDHVLRKEVDADCVTPSHPDPIKQGLSIDINTLSELCSSLGPHNQELIDKVSNLPYKPRLPVMDQLRQNNIQDHLKTLVAQVADDRQVAKQLMFEISHDHDYLERFSSNSSIRI